MEQEPADELLGGYGHLFALVAVAAVPVPEGDQTAPDFDYAMIGDSNTMSVAAKVVQQLLGAVERRLRVNDPVLLPQLADEIGKSL